MLVYKFGGSSIKNAAGIKNLGTIVRSQEGELVVVVSALGKTTNALEQLCFNSWEKGQLSLEDLNAIKAFHMAVADDLLPGHPGLSETITNDFSALQQTIKDNRYDDYDVFYDQVVSWGEIISSKIIHTYLTSLGLSVQWLDISRLITTDENFRSARVDWDRTKAQVRQTIHFRNYKMYLTQGFLGGTSNLMKTTLGREGSDYTAAILGNILQVEKVVIWKDVPGVMSADPHQFSNPELLPEISYQEAIELAFFGAKVIHPKTIKPLQNKNIPLLVKCFDFPEHPGTLIRTDRIPDLHVPSYIIKKDQLLLSISPRDFSFAIDDQLGHIFSILNRHKVRVNIIQNSAISVSICVDQDRYKKNGLLQDLQQDYIVYYNTGVELITIRHYTQESIDRIIHGNILIEQRTRSNAHFVIKPD